VQDVQRIGRDVFVATLYTTTARWSANTPLPLGVIPISGHQADKLKQRPFVIDGRCIAILPIVAAFFPHLPEADHGIKGAAPTGLARRITAMLVEMQRRQVAIEVRGPGRRR
jgi:hypothetical protein